MNGVRVKPGHSGALFGSQPRLAAEKLGDLVHEYGTDVGELAAIRPEDYKIHFMIQEAHGFDVWKNSYTPQAWPIGDTHAHLIMVV